MLLVVMLFWYYDIVSMLQKLVNIWHESYGFSLVAVSICMCLNLLFTFFGLSQLFAKSQSLYCCMTDFCFLYCPLVLNCICATLVFWTAFVPQCHMPHWHDILINLQGKLLKWGSKKNEKFIPLKSCLSIPENIPEKIPEIHQSIGLINLSSKVTLTPFVNWT